jgi:hypothetical protein
MTFGGGAILTPGWLKKAFASSQSMSHTSSIQNFLDPFFTNSLMHSSSYQ